MSNRPGLSVMQPQPQPQPTVPTHFERRLWVYVGGLPPHAAILRPSGWRQGVEPIYSSAMRGSSSVNTACSTPAVASPSAVENCCSPPPARTSRRNSPSPLNARVSWSALSRTSGSSSLALVSRTDGGSIGRRVSGDREKSRSRQSSRNSVRRRILVFGSAARAARHGGTCGRASTAAAASADARRRADTARHAFCRTAVVASGGSGLRSASSTRCACRARHAR
mmetsp:Transcript_14436/g.47165  ORF Transcript_14436/g.47165 Transcript_14436/m.47165 type:complete len:224 (+) Transcript_14436:143-814(+)